MALRIRKNGDILCAANSKPKKGDRYIDDDLHYILTAFTESIRPSKTIEEDNLWFWNIKPDMLEHLADIEFCRHIVNRYPKAYSVKNSNLNEIVKNKIKNIDFNCLIQFDDYRENMEELGFTPVESILILNELDRVLKIKDFSEYKNKKWKIK